MSYARHVNRGFGSAWKGIIFRRKHDDLKDIVARSKEHFYSAFPGARFLDSSSLYMWRFPRGETLMFRHALDVRAYGTYHGWQIPFLGFEELTEWPTLEFYDKIRTICRSTVPTIPRIIRSACNPHGVGHSEVKARFVDPAPGGQVIDDDKGERVRITGYYFENPHLTQNDPEYIAELERIGDPNLRSAWLYGSWDIVAGGIFDGRWSPSNSIVRPFHVPKTWRVDRTYDHGSSAPFACLWWAESDGSDYYDWQGRAISTVRGDLFLIREWYGWNGEPNRGLRMLNSEIGRGIAERDKEIQDQLGMKVHPGPADTQIFNVVNGQSVHDDFLRHNVRFTEANKSPGSRVVGWNAIGERMQATKDQDGRPGLYIVETCRQFLRTVPILPRDEKNADDVDTESEDHIGDATRYRIHQRSARARKAKLTGL